MEPRSPLYMTPNMTELPKSIFFDFGNELLPIINLMTEFYPYYTERDYETTVKKMVYAITHQADMDYQVAAFAVEIMGDYFELFNMATQARLFEVQNLLMQAALKMSARIASENGYVSGVFPYRYIGMHMNCEILLQNVSSLNYNIELNQKPFFFNHV